MFAQCLSPFCNHFTRFAGVVSYFLCAHIFIRIFGRILFRPFPLFFSGPCSVLPISRFIPSALSFTVFWQISGSFVQRQKRIAIYHVKKFVKDSQLWKQTLSILPDFLENWHFISHFVWKSTKTLELLRIFDKLFDVINGEPFLTLYKTSAIDYWKTVV